MNFLFHERAEMYINNNRENKSKASLMYSLSIFQMQYDCQTVLSLLHSLQQNLITNWGILPYITLTTYSFIELFSDKFKNFTIPDSLRIIDVRMKLKIFEENYSRSKRMILNIDYLQDQAFKRRLKYKFLKNINSYYNLGIYTDKSKTVIGNTQYCYYLLQDNRFLKKNLDYVAASFSVSPDNFCSDEYIKKECFQYSYNCARLIASACSGFEKANSGITIKTKTNNIDYYYADYNTNKKSKLFPNGKEGKAMILYLLHILSLINFLIYVLNEYEVDDYGWWLKINYIVYYFCIHKLTNLHEHLIQNKLMTSDIANYFKEMDIKNPKYMSGTLRNYIMHSKLTDKDGNSIIDTSYLDNTKPLFGLIETCFNGMSYNKLKISVISEMKRISVILSRWLDTQSLHIEKMDN